MDPNSATNWLVSLVGRKFLYTSELNADDTSTAKRILLNSARIKQLTGGERIACRANYGVETNVQITGHLFISCNYIPQFHGGLDDALKRRIKIISFRSQFVTDPKLVNPKDHVYLADETIGQKIGSVEWLQALDVLLDRYQQIQYMPTPEAIHENLQNQITKGIDDRYECVFKLLSACILYNPNGYIERDELFGRVVRANNLSFPPDVFYRQIVPAWLRLNYADKNIQYESSQFRINGGDRIRGWKSFQLTSTAN